MSQLQNLNDIRGWTTSTRASKIEETIRTNPQKPKIFSYPSDVENYGSKNIIRFKMYKSEGARFQKKTAKELQNQPAFTESSSSSLESRTEIIRDVYTVVNEVNLYMPDEITHAVNTQWDATELGVLGRLGGYSGANNASVNDVAGLAWSALLDMGSSAIQATTPIESRNLKNMMTSSISNPYMEMLFNGVENRSFSFTFKFTPKNEDEALTVRAIIKAFRHSAAPEFKNALRSHLMYPHIFDIQFIREGAENEWLTKISTCACTSVEVNDAGTGQYAIHKDGSPVETHMTVNFTEMDYLHKERIEDGY